MTPSPLPVMQLDCSTVGANQFVPPSLDYANLQPRVTVFWNSGVFNVSPHNYLEGQPLPRCCSCSVNAPCAMITARAGHAASLIAS